MRILAYADSRDFSGAEAVWSRLIDGLSAQAGIELRCAAPPDNGRIYDVALRAGGGAPPLPVPSQPLRLSGLWLLDPRRRRRIADVLASWCHDVLLVNLPSVEYGAGPLVGRARGGPPLVGVVHVPHSPRLAGFALGALRHRIARRALRGVDHVCVVAPSARGRLIADWGASVPITVLPLPVPTVRLGAREMARRALGVPKGRRAIGVIGRVSFKQKGHDVLVRCAELFASTRHDLVWVVAGGGRDLERCKRIVEERGLTGDFLFLGPVGKSDEVLSAVDAIVIPSRFEGLPLVALEAAAAGVPGVVSDVDGLRDVWPAQWRVPPGDPQALAERLGHLLSDRAGAVSALVEETRAQLGRLTSDDPATALGEVLRAVER